MCKITGLNLFKRTAFCQRNINIDKYLLSENSVGTDYKKISSQDTLISMKVIIKANKRAVDRKEKNTTSLN